MHPVIREQSGQDSDEFHLGELAPHTRAGTICPGDIRAFGGLDEFFFAGIRGGWGGLLEPALWSPLESVRAPGLRIGVRSLHVDVNGGVRGEDMCAAVVCGKGLRVVGCGFGDEDDGAVEAEGFVR